MWWRWGVLMGEAAADDVSLTNGVGFGVTGRMAVTVDDYGGYGLGISPNSEDAFQPANQNFIGLTWLSGAYVFVRTPDDKKTAVLLSENTKWKKAVEPAEGNGANGIEGDHAGLTRTVTQSIVTTGAAEANSAFVIADATAVPPLSLTFALRQQVMHVVANNTSELLQTYVITNNGQTSVDVIFHSEWDAQLIWKDGVETNKVGVGTGLCYLYMTDLTGGDRAVSMMDGGSSVPLHNYYGGKASLTPEAGPPVYGASDDKIFAAFGTPATWQNRIANVPGTLVAGDSGQGPGLDASMGLEWRFTIAMGAQTTIAVKRIYGTSNIVCPGGASCGDGMLDDGEQCDDGADTASCNLLSCTAAVCGDGYQNAMADEECELTGVGIASTTCNDDCTVAVCGDGKLNTVAGELCDDGAETDTCNANCQPAMCGDGYVNVAANEQCEDGELCDPVTCSYDFELGGGCAGCSAPTPDASWIFGLLALGVARRRRRYN